MALIANLQQTVKEVLRLDNTTLKINLSCFIVNNYFLDQKYICSDICLQLSFRTVFHPERSNSYASGRRMKGEFREG